MRRTKGDNTVSLPNVFKALSDPVRREILLKLKQKRKMSAGEIAAEFDLSNATISYHLSTLKKADLINGKSTHNRRERPVYGHCGWSRGRFYYRITTFEGRPWDARDPHKTTFMTLK